MRDALEDLFLSFASLDQGLLAKTGGMRGFCDGFLFLSF
jgi:hypothetical protein